LVFLWDKIIPKQLIMSKFLLFGIGLLLITATNAQKRSSLFLEGGAYSFSIINSRPGLPPIILPKPLPQLFTAMHQKTN